MVAADTGDERLVARLVAGDEGALACAYDQLAPLVYGIAARLTGDPDAAADVTQEVFVALWEHPERFDPSRGSLRTYLATIARRRAVDILRRAGRRDRREQRATARPVAPPDVEEAAAALVVGERVRQAVSQLPPEQREAVELAYYDGLTYREVATRLGLAEGTAKSRLRLALRRLALALHEEGYVQWA